MAVNDRPFVVELRRSGIALDVPTDRSLLDVIRDAVPDAPFSCEEGYCGSCEATVIDGVPDHRDDILTEDERRSGRTMFPCVSRSRSDRLVLDL
jgi:ferredoxin